MNNQENVVQAGEGYRLLLEGELILEADEYYVPSEQRWYQTAHDGERHDGKTLRRRRIEVGFTLPNLCAWTDCEAEGWQTSCGEAFVFIVGGPKENKFRFCPYCGLPVTGQKARPPLPQQKVGDREGLFEIWHEAQSEIYGQGDKRAVFLGEIFAKHFVLWLLEWQSPLKHGALGDLDLVSAIGVFEEWLKIPLPDSVLPTATSERRAGDLEVATAAMLRRELAQYRAIFSDSRAVHANILRGVLPLTREQALHIAGELPSPAPSVA